MSKLGNLARFGNEGYSKGSLKERDLTDGDLSRQISLLFKTGLSLEPIVQQVAPQSLPIAGCEEREEEKEETAWRIHSIHI